MSNGARAHFSSERLGALLALGALCLLFSIASPRFFAVDNFLNVLLQIAMNGILAVGMTLVVVSGGIDLSIGSLLALCGCVTGLLMGQGVALPLALGAGLGVGLLCGAINGSLVNRLRIPPFIATLGMMSSARGAAMVVTGGNPISELDERYFFLGTGSLLGIPVQAWIMLAVAAIGWFILERTRLGRYAIAIGSNEEAARLAGVPVARVKLTLYVLMGGLCALGSWIASARVAAADPSSGVNMELEAIAAVVIGGTSLKGGRGSVFGTLIGAAIMGVLSVGLVVIGISAFWQPVLVGAVIVAAVAIDLLRSRPRKALAAQRWPRRSALVIAAIAVVLGTLAFGFLRTRPEVDERAVIAVVGKASGGEYWLQVKAGAERRGEELGVEVLWQGPPAETDVARQLDLLDNLIQRGVDGIAVAPTDARALGPLVEKALEHDIPVVTIDSDTEAKDRLSYIGTDNYAAGVEAGKEMVRVLEGRGKVAIVTGVLGADNLRQRREGFRHGIAGSAIEVVAEQTDNGDRSRALAVVENILIGNPDVDAFFTDTAISGPAVAQALIARGLTGKVKLIAFDVTPVLLRHLEAGAAQALVAQQPDMIGALAVEMLVQQRRGENIAPLVDTGVTIVRAGDSKL